MKYSILLTILILSIAACQPRYGASIYNDDSGKCLAKLQYPAKYQTVYDTFYIYTGEDLEMVGVEVEEVMIEAPGGKWEKRRADADCLLANPDDCLVWCWIETPAKYGIIAYVTDTSAVKDYIIEVKDRSLLVQETYTDWGEVVCENDITQGLIKTMSEQLMMNGYLERVETRMNGPFKSGLLNFQRDQGLPVGQITFQTISALEKR